jgi:hypothetical protein
MVLRNKKTVERPNGIRVTVEAETPEQLDALFPVVVQMLDKFDKDQHEAFLNEPAEDL